MQQGTELRLFPAQARRPRKAKGLSRGMMLPRGLHASGRIRWFPVVADLKEKMTQKLSPQLDESDLDKSIGVLADMVDEECRSHREACRETSDLLINAIK